MTIVIYRENESQYLEVDSFQEAQEFYQEAGYQVERAD